MQTALLILPTIDRELRSWKLAARRECIEYGEHGLDVIENADDGRKLCFNCGGSL
jgi:hypothetical protein